MPLAVRGELVSVNDKEVPSLETKSRLACRKSYSPGSWRFDRVPIKHNSEQSNCDLNIASKSTRTKVSCTDHLLRKARA